VAVEGVSASPRLYSLPTYVSIRRGANCCRSCRRPRPLAVWLPDLSGRPTQTAIATPASAKLLLEVGCAGQVQATNWKSRLTQEHHEFMEEAVQRQGRAEG
jgi:hypothetical protein